MHSVYAHVEMNCQCDNIVFLYYSHQVGSVLSGCLVLSILFLSLQYLIDTVMQLQEDQSH